MSTWQSRKRRLVNFSSSPSIDIYVRTKDKEAAVKKVFKLDLMIISEGENKALQLRENKAAERYRCEICLIRIL